jgi:tetratricopeptide (TPR) repeat protein
MATSEDTVSGGNRLDKKLLKKSRAVRSLIGAIAVILIIGVVLAVAHPTGKASVLSEAQLVTQVNSDLKKSNYKTAVKVINSQPQTQANLETLAGLYNSQGQYSNALATYKLLATKYGLSDTTAAYVAQLYASLGNRSQSAYYYEQAASLTLKDMNNPYRVSLAAQYAANAKLEQQKQ